MGDTLPLREVCGFRWLRDQPRVLSWEAEDLGSGFRVGAGGDIRPGAILLGVPDPPPHRAALIVLSVALGASLLVIAFLVGRESARAPAAAEVLVPPASEPEVAAIREETGERRWPEWADLDEWEEVEDPSFAVEPAGERIEQRPDGTLLLSNRGSAADAPQVTSDSPHDPSRLAVTDYFLHMHTIQSEAGAGDPNTFAMGLIKAGIGGSTAGFDQLITDAKRMEGEIRKLTPPPSCVSYHEANLQALAESRAILEDTQEMFARRDFSKLTTIARRAGTLQLKAKALPEMRERITADASR